MESCEKRALTSMTFDVFTNQDVSKSLVEVQVDSHLMPLSTVPTKGQTISSSRYAVHHQNGVTEHSI